MEPQLRSISYLYVYVCLYAIDLADTPLWCAGCATADASPSGTAHRPHTRKHR